MASNLRVELRYVSQNASPEQKLKAFSNMMYAFKNQVNKLGVLTEWKLKSTYESRSQKIRRKKKESALRRLKESEPLQTRLRENFGGGQRKNWEDEENV